MLVITPQRGSQPRVQHHPVATPEDSALYPMLAKFNVVAYGDGDGGAGSGIRTRVTSLEG